MENNTNENYKPLTDSEKELLDFVVEKTDQWRDWRNTNFLSKWEEYERLWRGEWDAGDKTRDSERSRIITPALQQAIEAKQAEIAEAVFSRGYLFDIEDNMADEQSTDVEIMKNMMHEDFKKDRVEKAIDDIVLLAEIYGTGIGEWMVKETKELKPATQAIPGSQVSAIGVTESIRVSLKLKPVNPKNFLIDPNAVSIDDALGVAVEEYVSLHTIVKGIEEGKYRQCDIGPIYETDDLNPTSDDAFKEDKVLLIRYYGLVPREYLDGLENDGAEVADLFPEDSAADDYSDLVEAVVVIANGEHLLKAEATPYMMQDRPLGAYQSDSVPNFFFGRGTAEKGYNMQKALDAQMRSHLDSLALTTSPMMGMDATRMPRGAKFEIKPGKNILTNGNPQEILYPFKFGTTDASNAETAKAFERMLLQATGTMDSSSMPTQVAGGDAGGAGLSMALSGILKKNKRTLMNFQEDFLIPMIKKAAYRFMQFAPDRYPVKDFNFLPTATMGMVAREFEQQQFIGLMQTLGPNSPITPVLLKGVISNSSLHNKEELIAQLDQMSQPNPQQEQMAMASAQLDMQTKQALLAKTQADSQKAQADALLSMEKAKAVPQETQAKLVNALSQNMSDQAGTEQFAQRAKIAELMLKEKDINNKGKIVEMQMHEKSKNLANMQ